ncbi:MAG: hypothetical protein PHV06_11160, partial [bacterium]|nr:hypothetical protein [bacterium]
MTDNQKLEKQYKKIINRIQKYNGYDIILTTITFLHRNEPNTIQRMQNYFFWSLFFIIKLTFLYGNFFSYGQRGFGDREFNLLYKMIYDLEGMNKLPSEYDNVNIWLKTEAFKQFWIQEKPNITSFTRQKLLFSLDIHRLFYSKLMKTISGLEINDFIELAFISMSNFIVKKKSSLKKEFFGKSIESYSNETIDKFLSFISLDKDKAQEYLNSIEFNNKKIEDQLLIPTPLMRFPLFFHNDTYHCYSKQLFYYSMQNNLYTTMKDNDPQSFMDKFGNTFERYIKQGLDYIGIKYIE